MSATVGYPIKCPYIISVDKQEKSAFTFSSLIDPVSKSPLVVSTERVHLPTGDYSLRFHVPPITIDWHDRVVVERKSLDDLFNSFMGAEREREERKLARLNELAFAAYVIEGTMADLMAYRCKFLPPETDQVARAEKMRNAIFKFQVVQYPRVHWFFEPTIERAEEATWRVLDWFYKNSLARTQ